MCVTALVWLAALGLAVQGWSQVQNASLTGLVSDPSGASSRRRDGDGQG